MYAKIFSFGLQGISSYLVDVEVDSRRGLPGFDIVGLPDATVRESRDRIQSAIKNLGYPRLNSKIVVNLAPADKRKEGSVYDLPILLALLTAVGYEDFHFPHLAVIGEIGLSGEIRGLDGVLPMILDAKKLGIQTVIVPEENGGEASVVEGITVYTASHTQQVVHYLKGEGKLSTPKPHVSKPLPLDKLLDFSHVKGQEQAKKAIEVAAAGGHNLLLIGPPGTGKSMLAKRIPSILPPLTTMEAVETTKVYSVAGLLETNQSLITQRPFRAPHHSVSPGALIGGGSSPKPGDISLAHNGVLFLDEMPEFPKASLEVMRQPLEDGKVVISRVRYRVEYPASTMLVGAMNPCPCGYYGSNQKECSCTPYRIQQYLGRLSGPMLDRIDIQMEVQPVSYSQLQTTQSTGSSAEMRERVVAARKIQEKRYKKLGITCNAQLPPAYLSTYCKLGEKAEELLKIAFEALGLSARGYDRILKVSRTLADLDGAEEISAHHVSQGIQFRSLDRKYWNT